MERNQKIHEQKEFNLFEFESQDATKRSFASADSRTNSLLDDYVTLGENIVFVLGSYDNFSQCFIFSLSTVTMSWSNLTGVSRMNYSYQEPNFETYACPFLEEYDCKDEGCDSEVESEDDEWPGTENQWCPLLDLFYH